MSAARTYLDHNASAPLRPAAREAVVAALDVFGNASSVHGEGRRARALIDEAREAVAQLVNARPAEVVFTSGATEANVWALSQPWERIAVAGIEHDSGARSCRPGCSGARASGDRACLLRWTAPWMSRASRTARAF